MKRSCILTLCICAYSFVRAQVDLKELVGFLDLNHSRLENQILKKGYRAEQLWGNAGQLKHSYIQIRKEQDSTVTRFLQIGAESNNSLTYETSSQKEWSSLQEELKRAGFLNRTGPGNSTTFQKQGWMMECSEKTLDSTRLFVLKAARKNLPKAKEIVFAEDLMNLDAHEYICEVFGRNNVRTDRFRYSETESDPCSILFPDSPQEVVFIWKDTVNMRGISFLLIGGALYADKNKAANMPLNTWRSRQGIYCGIGLQELEQLNGSTVNFYNWQTESAGYLAPGNKGRLDFERLGLLLNCINCDINSRGKAVISSDQSHLQNQRVYLSRYFLMPSKS